MQKKVLNKARPEVKITLDKVRTLKLDLNAIISFEEVSGKSLMHGKFKVKDMSPKDFRAILWACLIHEDDELTIKQVGSFVEAGNMVEIAERLNESFEVSVPDSGGKEDVPLT